MIFSLFSCILHVNINDNYLHYEFRYDSNVLGLLSV